MNSIKVLKKEHRQTTRTKVLKVCSSKHKDVLSFKKEEHREANDLYSVSIANLR